MRRNPIYQEFLVTVLNLPNPYKYTAKELRHYRFGYFASPEVRPKSVYCIVFVFLYLLCY